MGVHATPGEAEPWRGRGRLRWAAVLMRRALACSHSGASGCSGAGVIGEMFDCGCCVRAGATSVIAGPGEEPASGLLQPL